MERRLERQLMRPRAQTAISLVALAACVLAVGFSAASFTDTTQNPQTVSAAADWIAPSAEASTIAISATNNAGYIKSKGTYYVYANVVESGNPASGVASVKANVGNITSGQTAVSLVAGSYTVDGASYDYRSAQLTADGVTGAKSYTLKLEDKAANSRTQEFSVNVLGAFAGSKFDTANGPGGKEGKAEKGDILTFTYSNVPEASTILSSWTGSSPASVSVTITQSSNNDSLTVSNTSLGSVALKGNYVSSTVTYSGSSMALSGSSIVVTLGAPNSSSSIEEEEAAGRRSGRRCRRFTTSPEAPVRRRRSPRRTNASSECLQAG